MSAPDYRCPACDSRELVPAERPGEPPGFTCLACRLTASAAAFEDTRAGVLILAWHETRPDGEPTPVPRWEPCRGFAAAMRRYGELIQCDQVTSVTLAAPIASTDFDAQASLAGEGTRASTP